MLPFNGPWLCCCDYGIGSHFSGKLSNTLTGASWFGFHDYMKNLGFQIYGDCGCNDIMKVCP